MNINFKQPKYVLPLIALPFLCLFFYVYQSSFAKTPVQDQKTEGIRDQVGEVSSDIKQKQLTDKLDAYRDQYREADGNTAVTAITEETRADSAKAGNPILNYTPPKNEVPEQDKALAAALNQLSQRKRAAPQPEPPPKEPDQMALFKTQMAYMDSMGKAADPEKLAEAKKGKEQALVESKRPKALSVCKADTTDLNFNTLMPGRSAKPITAVIDENITGYAGSRIRIRLLEDIKAGETVIPKGEFLYAEITGFSAQRVALTISSVLTQGKILPVKMEVYDLDGSPGLYVPGSAFRDFTKDLGGNSMQGVNLQGSAGNQFLMSTVDKLFQSTSSAIAEAIRKNKAKLKYNSYIYLIDSK
jgi:conjugative transposon TraM protein